jgi:opacity protein-like surface antigen
MRAKLLGAALAALLIPAAMMVSWAGELPQKGKIAAPVTTAAADDAGWNRTGFYVGLLGAYDTTVLEAEGIDLANGKLMGGAAVGWNFRAGGFVYGIEADWLFTGISASQTVDEVTLKASTEHLVSLRGRLGLPVGPALVYGTLGPAWQHARLSISDGGEGISERTWQLGLAVGGGGEVELTRSFALRLEAIHYVFPDDGAPLRDLFDSENQHTTVRAGALFKF